MPLTLDFLDTYHLMAVTEEIVPVQTFFRDRYFPTNAEDIFMSDKVLTEYKKGDRKMAAFVAPRSGGIAMERQGYAIHEYQPAKISVTRSLTVDELTMRGFGEALYPGSKPAERATRLQLKDFNEMNERIVRREEWMAVQTMINNGCDMQEYIDNDTKGDLRTVRFYDDTSDHTYKVDKKWNAADGNIMGDVRAMCKLLQRRGLPAADLLLGSQVADAILENEKIVKLLDKNSGIITGEINQKTYSPSVVRMGKINFSGVELTLWDVSETYEDETGNDKPYFPETSAMVTAPGCGHMMYGKITQMPYGSDQYMDFAEKRVPKLIVKNEEDLRMLRLSTRPLAAPHNYCPYIYAANVVG